MTNPTPDSTVHLGGKIISDRVVAQLLQEMRTGRWAGADRLPAELDLADELGVSRTVIRDALSTLERAGYVERVRGIGTVVNRAVLALRSRLDQKLEYYPLIRSFGSYPHADGIQVQPLRASAELAQSLGWRRAPSCCASASGCWLTPPRSSTRSTTCPGPCWAARTTPSWI